MSAIPGSSARIQIEGAQTNAPGSESLFQAMGGAINFILDKLDPVGSYKWSDLTEAQFQAELPTSAQEWVIADGRSVIGSRYATIRGVTNIPDRRGHYIRAKNNGRVDGFEDPSGDLPIGSYEDDRVRAHNHVWSNYDGGFSSSQKTFNTVGNIVSYDYTGGFTANGQELALSGALLSNTPRTHCTAGIFSYDVPSLSGLTNPANNFVETRVKSGVGNFFVRIN